eukprot:jgi/Chlat1/3793/Chrsp259S03927
MCDAPAMPPFHLAIPVADIAAARDFYGGVLGLPEGRSARTWVDFNFYGHQLVAHQWTMFFRDPSGNALEFKAMTNTDNLFARYNVDEVAAAATRSEAYNGDGSSHKSTQ